jgi:hypothetical protein
MALTNVAIERRTPISTGLKPKRAKYMTRTTCRNPMPIRLVDIESINKVRSRSKPLGSFNRENENPM